MFLLSCYITSKHTKYTSNSEDIKITNLYILEFDFLKFIFNFVVVVVCFIWLHWVLAATRGIFVAACGIFCCGVWAPEHAGSVVRCTGLVALQHVGS